MYLKPALLLLFICLFSAASAQPPDKFPRSFAGAYLGPNLSGFTGNYHSNIPGETGKIRVRTQYGFYGKIYINRDFSVFTGLELLLNGALTKDKDATSASVTVSYVAKTNLSTFTIPGLLTFTPKEYLGIVVGPQFDYILSATEPWNRSDVNMPSDYQEDVIEKYNRIGLSLALGAYYMLLNGSTMHLRYSQGLTEMTKAEYGNARPYAIQFYLGLNIYKKN